MKFPFFRANDDRNGGGVADPTEVPRMGGQVLPAAVANDASTEDVSTPEPQVEPAAQTRIPQVTSTQAPVGPTKIAVRDVSVFYGDKQALHDVSIDIPDKTVTAFIGPSGCGKSTFLRCINRMNDTIQGARVTGRIEMDGQDVNARSVDPVLLRA